MMSEERPDDNELDLTAIERDLRAQQAEVRERLAELSRPPERGSQVAFGKRIGDGTSEAVSRLTEVGVFETLTDSESHLARALEKIDEGTYGTCDSCAAQIPAGRLRAVPHSALCVECARAGAATGA